MSSMVNKLKYNPVLQLGPGCAAVDDIVPKISYHLAAPLFSLMSNSDQFYLPQLNSCSPPCQHRHQSLPVLQLQEDNCSGQLHHRTPWTNGDTHQVYDFIMHCKVWHQWQVFTAAGTGLGMAINFSIDTIDRDNFIMITRWWLMWWTSWTSPPSIRLLPTWSWWHQLSIFDIWICPFIETLSW